GEDVGEVFGDNVLQLFLWQNPIEISLEPRRLGFLVVFESQLMGQEIRRAKFSYLLILSADFKRPVEQVYQHLVVRRFRRAETSERDKLLIELVPELVMLGVERFNALPLRNAHQKVF